jgi:hypothetical protein
LDQSGRGDHIKPSIQSIKMKNTLASTSADGGQALDLAKTTTGNGFTKLVLGV